MNVAVVEDCREHSELIKEYIREWSLLTGNKVSVAEFPDGDNFLFHNQDTSNIDAVFMDIQMPGISGIDLARKLRESNQELAIIFTTGIDDYIAEGYELEAIHYLIKPVSAQKVRFCLDKIAQKESIKEQYITINGVEDIFKVAYSKLWWISAMGHHVMIGVEDENGIVKRVSAGNSIGEMEKLLLTDRMFRKTHRSYIVNLAHVRSITKTDVIMDNQDMIPLSRRMYQQVNESFINYYIGKE